MYRVRLPISTLGPYLIMLVLLWVKVFTFGELLLRPLNIEHLYPAA
jgi:hypothetical protein